MKKLFILCLILFRSGLAFSVEDCSDPTIANLVLRAKNEIQDRQYLTLASSNLQGDPWNSPVYTAFDSTYSFFWISDKNSRHSKNLRDNSKVFVVIYDSTAILGTGFGVYMQGHAYELNRVDEIAYGLQQIEERADALLPPPENFQGTFRDRVYKFIPEKFWVNVFIEIKDEFVDRRVNITKCMKESI